MKRTVMVTGITGFIGGELARRLIKDGWTVAAIVRICSELSSIEDIHSDIKTYIYDGTTESLLAIMREVKPDVVFHLASLVLVEHTSEKIPELINSNVLFGTQLLESMVACGVNAFVNAGTSWQNYHSNEYRAVNLYAATKQAFEDILSFYVDKFKISSVTLQLFDTYGPNDKRRKLINLLVEAIKNSYDLELSPGDQIIDISYIDDVVEHFVRAGIHCLEQKTAKSECFYVSGSRLTVKALVQDIRFFVRSDANITFGGRPYRDREVMYLPPVDAKTPPWNDAFVRTSLEQGVLKLIRK